MISVITPTMWRFEPFCEFLQDLVELDVIGEVIIINNSQENTPNKNILNHDKIKMINAEQNIFVNPSCE